jgi:acyl-CoA synthetase (AMP-forming)/AMP-acid ligase II/NAD(P)-dependent dehydrogenase (short-subunit alcohol dehydrogenase family)/aryl carrier-like protein
MSLHSQHRAHHLLASMSGVTDCAVMRRVNLAGTVEWLAYVVPSGLFEPRRFLDEAAKLLPEELHPSACVAVSSLPLASDGGIDFVRLAALPVIGGELARAAEGALLSEVPAQRVSCIIEKVAYPAGGYHSYDLLPDSSRRDREPQDRAQDVPQEIQTSGLPSISHGPELTAAIPNQLWNVLHNAAASQPKHGVTYVSAEGVQFFQSYPEILRDAERIAGGLSQRGLKPGDTVLFQLDDKRDFVAAFWACALAGFIAAPVAVPAGFHEFNAAVAKVYNCWLAQEKPAIITSNTLKDAVLSIGALADFSGARVLSIRELRQSVAAPQYHYGSPDDLSLILFTSGSTGSPKGVQLSQRNLVARSAGTSQRNGFDPSDVVVNWFPLDHVGGIVMSHLQYTSVAGRQVEASPIWILEDPLRWLDLIDRYRATCTWAPNFAFNLVNKSVRGAEPGRWDLTSMRFILNGGEAIVPATVLTFLELLQPFGLSSESMHPSWGMSETSSGVLFSDRCRPGICKLTDNFVEVGSPIPGLSARIVDAEGAPVPENWIGRLQVRGAAVTKGYYKNPNLNAETFTRDGWFDTGDLACMRDGCVTITGRTKDVIIVNGANHYCHELESVVEQVHGVEISYTAASPVTLPGANTDAFCVFFSPTVENRADPSEVVAAISSHLSASVGVRPAHVVPMDRVDVPKTEIGKIQRAQLRARFEAGEFDAVLRKLDVQAGRAERIPDWFFRRTWKPRQREAISELSSRVYLILTDDADLTEEFRLRIGSVSGQLISVRSGGAFRRCDDAQYEIEPGSGQDHQRLFSDLQQRGLLPHTILHCWTYAPWVAQESTDAVRRALIDSNDSLLHLVQAAMVEIRGFELLCLSRHAQSVKDGEVLVPARAVSVPFLRTLAVESDEVHCRHLDLSAGSAADAAEAVIVELTMPRTAIEVAYRDKTRFEPVLERTSMMDHPAAPVPIENGGMYLISGGLGGIGTELVLELHRRYNIKALLVGSTKSSEIDSGLGEGEEEKRHRIRILQTEGVDFLYKALSLDDEVALNQAAVEAESHWGQALLGVFHLAGVGNLKQHWEEIHQHSINVESPSTFAWMFKAKAYGTENLFRLLEHRPGSLFVGFSSVNSIFGGSTFSAYSCANRYLDAFCQSRSADSQVRTYCMNWSQWDNLGVSAGGPGFGRQVAGERGYSLVGRDNGLLSTLAVLSRGGPQTIIGLDSTSPAIRAEMHSDCHAMESLALMFSGTEKPKGGRIEIQDRFGISLSVNCIPVPIGEWEAKLSAQTRGRRQILPRTPEEEQMTQIWREVLQVSSVGVTDSLFDLGGDSLTAIQLMNRIRKECHVALSMRTLFEAPTVERLVISLAGMQSVSIATPTQDASKVVGKPLPDVEDLSDDDVDALLRSLIANEEIGR